MTQSAPRVKWHTKAPDCVKDLMSAILSKNELSSEGVALSGNFLRMSFPSELFASQPGRGGDSFVSDRLSYVCSDHLWGPECKILQEYIVLSQSK